MPGSRARLPGPPQTRSKLRCRARGVLLQADGRFAEALYSRCPDMLPLHDALVEVAAAWELGSGWR